MIEVEIDRLRGLNHDLRVESTVVEFLIREGYHRTLGARPMRAAVERHLQNAIAARVLRGGAESGSLVVDELQGLLLLR